MSATETHPVPVWTLGDRLTKAREHAGLTQQQMADQLQIGRRSIVRYESDRTPPRSIVIAYSAVTAVPLWWLDGPQDGDAVTTWYTAPGSVAA